MRLIKIAVILASLGLIACIVAHTSYIVRVNYFLREGRLKQLVFLEKLKSQEEVFRYKRWRMMRINGAFGKSVDSYYLVRGIWWNQISGLGLFSGRYKDPKRLIPKTLDSLVYARLVFYAEFDLDSMACLNAKVSGDYDGVVVKNDSAVMQLKENDVIKQSSRYVLRD